MFLHVGNNKNIRKSSVIGIFDMENTTVMKSTVDYLNKAEKDGSVNNVAPFELPKSFVVTNTKKGKKIHISPVSVGTILKRTESKIPT